MSADGIEYELTRVRLGDGLETRSTSSAINRDGGGSATLVQRGHLLNRPYSDDDQPAPELRPVVTALLFEPA